GEDPPHQPGRSFRQPEPTRSPEGPRRDPERDLLATRDPMIRLGLADDLAAQVDEHLRDVDPDGTDVEARTAQRRRERERGGLLVDRVLRDPAQLRGEDGPDRSGIDGAVRLAARALIDRA